MAEKLLVEFSGKKDLSKYVRMLIAGEAGSGKTKFAGTAPNPIWAAAYPDSIALAKRENTRYVTVNSQDDLLLLKKALQQGLVEADTVVVDRIDEIQRRMFLNRMISEKRDFLKNEDWNWMEAKLNQIAKGLCDLEMHVIFITGTRDQGGFDGQDLITKPDIQGGFAQDIYSYVDYALHLESSMNLSDDEAEVVVKDNKMEFPEKVKWEIQGSIFRTEPSHRYPWIFDRTDSLYNFTLPEFRGILDLRNEMLENSFVSEQNNPLEIVFEDTKTPDTKDLTVPGMSKDDKVNKILKKSIK